MLRLSGPGGGAPLRQPPGLLRVPAVSPLPRLPGTVQYSIVQYSTVQYSTVQYSTVQYSDNDQACLNTHVLQFADTGLTAHTVGEGTGTFSMMVSIYLSTEATRSMKKHSAFYNEFS